MKTCITAPEPIKATWTSGGGIEDGFVLGAVKAGGSALLLVTSSGIMTAPAFFREESPTLLAFIERAKAELLPKPKRGMGEVTVDDLLTLVIRAAYAGVNAHNTTLLRKWATERNIQLPEEG